MPFSEAVSDYNPKMNIYHRMAYFVAEVIHIRPKEILDEWGVAELIVTFGCYANERASQQYSQWKELDPDTRARTERPNKYIVYFHDTEEENIEEWQQNRQ